MTNNMIKNIESDIRTFSAFIIFLLSFSLSVVRKNKAEPRLMRIMKNIVIKNISNVSSKMISFFMLKNSLIN
jgi:hypothetical protein